MSINILKLSDVTQLPGFEAWLRQFLTTDSGSTVGDAGSGFGDDSETDDDSVGSTSTIGDADTGF